MCAQSHVRGTSDSDDDFPLSALKKHKGRTEEEEDEQSHLDCFNSSGSDEEAAQTKKEPAAPTIPEKRVIRRSRTDKFHAAPKATVDLFNQEVFGADLSARALAYVLIVT